jgi:GxxExxY protein
MGFELVRAGRRVRTQVALPIVYADTKLDAGYRIDLTADERVIVEIKSVEALAPIHDAQILTYLKLSGRRLGFLINFNVPLYKDGIRRFVL